MIMWGIWLYVTGNYRRDSDFISIFNAYCIILGIDIAHYLLAFRRSEWVLLVEGLIVLYAGYKYLSKAYKRRRCAGN